MVPYIHRHFNLLIVNKLNKSKPTKGHLNGFYPHLKSLKSQTFITWNGIKIGNKTVSIVPLLCTRLDKIFTLIYILVDIFEDFVKISSIFLFYFTVFHTRFYIKLIALHLFRNNGCADGIVIYL